MIRTENISKRFGDVAAVVGLTLDVKRGMRFGLVGPNGAGKTTTLRMLAGLLEPTAGRVFIDERQVRFGDRHIFPRIGYMPDRFGMYETLTVREYLDYFGQCYRVASRERARRIEELLTLVRLSECSEMSVSALSRGMRQRLLIAKTLIHNPDLLILDEPTSGLDPRSRIELKEILRELAAPDRTIIVASNILVDLSQFCDSLGIIDRGRLIESGTMESLIAKYKKEHSVTARITAGLERVEELLASESRVKSLLIEGNLLKLRYEGTYTELAELNCRLNEAGVRLTGFCQQQDTIEDIFLMVTEKLS